MNNPIHKNQVNHIHYKDPLAIKSTSDSLITYLPKNMANFIVLCIGTDRSTGDSLGPLTGTFFSEMKPTNLTLYGTLHEPIHAINLEKSIKTIKMSYNNPFIIAIDASLGKSSSIGNIISGNGPLQPGAALNKKLPSVGNVHVTGVVNVGGYMDYTVLQSTRLSIVHDMAYKLALILKKIDIWLHYDELNKFKKTEGKYKESS